MLADTVESRLRDLMVAAAEEDDGKQGQLAQSVNEKDPFASDAKALNETVVKLFSANELARLIGNLDELQGEEESDDEGGVEVE